MYDLYRNMYYLGVGVLGGGGGVMTDQFHVICFACSALCHLCGPRCSYIYQSYVLFGTIEPRYRTKRNRKPGEIGNRFILHYN